MKFIEIQDILRQLQIFSINDLRNIDPQFEKKKIYLWKKNWLIKSIYRWYYILNKQEINTWILHKIANIIYNPSYISLETALSYYNLIPEAVYTTTSITTKKTLEINNEYLDFSYKSIKSDLFWWYKIESIKENNYLIADIEKTLLDYFYLNKQVNNENDIIWLRLNSQILKKQIDRKKIKKYLKRFNKKFLNKKIDLLFKLLDEWLI